MMETGNRAREKTCQVQRRWDANYAWIHIYVRLVSVFLSHPSISIIQLQLCEEFVMIITYFSSLFRCGCRCCCCCCYFFPFVWLASFESVGLRLKEKCANRNGKGIGEMKRLCVRACVRARVYATHSIRDSQSVNDLNGRRCKVIAMRKEERINKWVEQEREGQERSEIKRHRPGLSYENSSENDDDDGSGGWRKKYHGNSTIGDTKTQPQSISLSVRFLWLCTRFDPFRCDLSMPNTHAAISWHMIVQCASSIH